MAQAGERVILVKNYGSSEGPFQMKAGSRFPITGMVLGYPIPLTTPPVPRKETASLPPNPVREQALTTIAERLIQPGDLSEIGERLALNGVRLWSERIPTHDLVALARQNQGISKLRSMVKIPIDPNILLPGFAESLQSQLSETTRGTSITNIQAGCTITLPSLKHCQGLNQGNKDQEEMLQDVVNQLAHAYDEPNDTYKQQCLEGNRWLIKQIAGTQPNRVQELKAIKAIEGLGKQPIENAIEALKPYMTANPGPLYKEFVRKG